MKVKLPLLGEIKTGKDADSVEIIKEVIKKEKFFDTLGGMLEFGAQKLSNEKSVSSKLLDANQGWVYRNNDAIAQEVSKLEFELYTIGIKEGEIVYNPILSHPLLSLLDKPNKETTKNDAIYIIQSHKKLTGNAYWLKLRNGNQVVSLRTLPPDKVTLVLENPNNEQAIIRGYKYEDTIDGKRISFTYRPEDIIHFKKPDPDKVFIGKGAVEALADTIDLDNLTEEITKKFFQNGAISNFVLTTDNKLNDEQLKRLKAEMKSTYGGTSNAFKAMILGGGLKPQDISYSNKDMQFLDQLEWYRDKIMYGFGNTKASLGMIDDVNRASHEGSIIEWQRNTVKPDMQSIVNTLNEFLVPEFGENLVLGFSDPVPEDRSDDVKEASDLFNASLVTRDEARAIIDYDPAEEGGSDYRQSGSPIIPNPDGGEDE